MKMFPIGLSVILVGLYLIKYSFDLKKKIELSLSWPHVEGVITESRTVSFKATTNDYGIVVRYNYKIKDVSYQGYKPFLYSVTTKNEAEEFVANFPNGIKTNVYYDPLNPKDSVLIPGPRVDKKSHELFMGLVVLFVGIVVCFLNFPGK